MALLKPTPPAKRRILHVGDKGNDVLAAQRAVKKALKKVGLVAINAANGIYGDGMLNDTLRFQRAYKIQPSGRIGENSWVALDPFLDAYGKLLLAPAPKPVASPGARVAHEARVLATYAPRHYTQTRPAQMTLDGWRSRGGDCSGTSILVYKLTGVPDPNGTSFTGYGNTYSLLQRGMLVPENETKPGDLVFWGGGEHVTIALGGAGDSVFSHGSEGGPRIESWGYRSDRYQVRRYV